MVAQKPRRRHYSTGDEALDARIAELVAVAGRTNDSDLLEEMIKTCFRLDRDRSDRGEMKLVNAALKEFAYAFKVFKGYKSYRKVGIFGSARTVPQDPAYEVARHFAAAMAAKNWMVITGAGPGIMAAGHEGAGAERSFGAAIRLPMESEPNLFIEGDAKLINFKYFFTRKVTFLKESDAFALLPGGFGTLDEAFELLTLMQTGKSDVKPIILLEEPGGTYWTEWLRFVQERLLERGLVSKEDLLMVKRTDTVEQAVQEIVRFYSNYQSQRYVDGRLVLRLLRLPPREGLEKLALSFADIMREPGLQPVEASAREIDDGDALELRRLALEFSQTSFGRLRQLVDALNRY
ncbi:MAG: TIGR00730 family Rossman fold protein [Chloroflexi bacterium]|nr:MAG: TIGR00730 family Rossman fold protein [Chloroflexota bacterium]